MQVLLTNDDGVDAAGLLTLRDCLVGVGATVVTVAPARDCSGLARSCTFKTPVSVTRRLGGSHPVYVCDGTPTDCVRLALLAGLVEDVALVVSGVNHGTNLGDDVYYSGTVSAGLEAALLGVSSVCVSQQFAQLWSVPGPGAALVAEPSFEAAASVAASIAAALARSRPTEPLVLSVNVPAKPASREVTLTRLGMRPYAHGSVDAAHDDGVTRSYYLFGPPGEEPRLPAGAHGTDFAAIRSGRISMTPLYLAPDVDDLPAGQQQLLSSVLAAVNEHPENL
ncbi:5'/3'-nucleotidase SurE [Nocardioides islandensis]|jgi:5'-nucleotidase|uniref:5'-nucleotidase SurE n=1 Tax=Nocardioides islandensis TaxID=433663 RepID=A0A930VHP7_9ACTN|nr:5'/3'-nucleotidase SurE [Nocardioides islandensis]MBF4765826.1 5'/3'-nucleotidase SurE [Nocardioides islandensis]